MLDNWSNHQDDLESAGKTSIAPHDYDDVMAVQTDRRSDIAGGVQNFEVLLRTGHPPELWARLRAWLARLGCLFLEPRPQVLGAGSLDWPVRKLINSTLSKIFTLSDTDGLNITVPVVLPFSGLTCRETEMRLTFYQSTG